MRKNALAGFGKKLVSTVIAAALSFSLVACGGGAGGEEGTTTAPVSGPHESKNGIITQDDGTIREDMNAIELSKLMGNGINLGNTMEAYGRLALGTDADVSQYEQYWGQPITTQEMISGMKKCGFDTLRIPVAWTNMMKFEDGDYTINEALLDRVEEIINYARNEDMYVIVNDHWDGSWWGMFGSATPETRENAMELYTSMWKQIAERYAEYSDYLIFESGNEELGSRFNDVDVAADSGTLSEDECYETANKVNQAFVDTVRATGGNNAKRFLLIAGYGTEINNTLDARWHMPTDTIDGKLFVSVHFYEPTGYCLWDIDNWGTKEEIQAVNDQLAKLSEFTEQGYGVIIGEYGALPKGSKLKDNAVVYNTNILDNCDILNVVPVLWDTNGLYDKEFLSMVSSTMQKEYQSRNVAAEATMTEEEIVEKAKAHMQETYENGKEGFSLDPNVAMAWIMYTSGDWTAQYSVGDVYDPTSSSAGVVGTDVEITGEGTYTVALDFTGYSAGSAQGTAFSALAIANGETHFPGYVIDIKEIKINGEVYEPLALGYTTSDDEICTRVNLYNEWIPEIPDGVRLPEGASLSDASPCIVDKDLGAVKTIEITFDYVAP